MKKQREEGIQQDSRRYLLVILPQARDKQGSVYRVASLKASSVLIADLRFRVFKPLLGQYECLWNRSAAIPVLVGILNHGRRVCPALAEQKAPPGAGFGPVAFILDQLIS